MSSSTTPWSKGRDARQLLTLFAASGDDGRGLRRHGRESVRRRGAEKGVWRTRIDPASKRKSDATGKVNGPIRGYCRNVGRRDGAQGDAAPNEWPRVGPAKIHGTLWNSPLGPTGAGHFFREPWYVIVVYITKCRGIFHPINRRVFLQ